VLWLTPVILAIWEVGFQFKASLSKKFNKNPISTDKKLGMVVDLSSQLHGK
jgi:hypothetical protein